MRIEQLNGQCGIYLLSGLHVTPEENLRVIVGSEAFVTTGTRAIAVILSANVMWTDVARAKGALSSGEKLKRHITEKKFGTVKTMGPILNPNTKNKITVYVWTPNAKFMKSNYF